MINRAWFAKSTSDELFSLSIRTDKDVDPCFPVLFLPSKDRKITERHNSIGLFTTEQLIELRNNIDKVLE
ncbi:MAG: hypothetical protein Q7R33_02850 [Nitrosarchaeum sp.]|nr:hypothetical protein [Nitrosarchaeum sp.]